MQEQIVLIGCFLNLKSLGQVANEMYLAESWVWKIRRKAVGSMETVLEQEGELQKWIRKQKRWI